MGMPKNKQLLKMMEDPEVRKILDEAELAVLADSSKKELMELKEELFFTIDEKQHDADLSEKGRKFLNPNDPDAFVIPDLVTALQEIDSRPGEDGEKEKKKQQVQQAFDERSEKIHNISQLLRAYCLFEKDVEYVVQDNKVLIVDEFTGRLMPGRRWSDGLHQAVEAKEGVAIERETQTLATITIQNYFRLYKKLAGMTGTAETEATEFENIYKLGVIVIPTNKPCVRIDENDVVYKTRREKYNAIIKEIVERHRKGQPMLVGTVSVEASEVLSRMLKRTGHPAQRSEREIPPARSRNHRPRRPARLRHHRHQHGGPRHRHQTRFRRHRSSAACTSSAASGTKRGASTGSFADVARARATRAVRGSTSRSKTI